MKQLANLFLLIFFFLPLFSQKNDSISKFEFKGKLFVHYNTSFDTNFTMLSNYFEINRAYFTAKFKVSDKFGANITTDVRADKTSKTYFVIPKYVFVYFKPFNGTFGENINIKVGLIPRPWIKYEETINPYRVTQTMFVEYWGIVNSSDAGISLSFPLGRKIDGNEGRFGSFIIGVYNGVGYRRLEENKNKTLEGRISFRPFKKTALHLSYSFIYGKSGTTEDTIYYFANFFAANILALDFSNKFLKFVCDFYQGYGDYGFQYYRENSVPFANYGYSQFLELKFFKKIGIFARYDFFYTEKENTEQKRFFSGLSYYFNNNKFVLQHTYLPKTGHNLLFALDFRF